MFQSPRERFSRVPGSRSRGGAGLVLALDREVVVAHGGQIAVESQVGRGTVSIFSLPTDPDLAQLASHEGAIQ